MRGGARRGAKRAAKSSGSRASPVRLRRAVVAVGSLVLAVALSGYIERAERPHAAAEAVSMVADDMRCAKGEGAQEDLKAALPEKFEAEVFACGSRRDVRVDERSRVVGFAALLPAQDEFGALCNELAEKGWVRAGKGAAAGGTFVKATGRYRWVFVSCVQVGAAASVVVNYQESDKEGLNHG